METTIKIAFDILAFASIMVLIVGGLAVIASLMGIFNMAHGEFVLLGAYTVFLFHRCGLPTWYGMLLAPFVAAAFGLLVEATVIRRLYATPIIAMLATYSIGLIVRETVRVLIGGQYYSVEGPLPGAYTIGGMHFSIWRTLIIVVTVAVIFACFLFLTRTTIGLQIRGSLENPLLARASGVSTKRLYAFTFAFGSALAGLAGALMVPLFSLSADLGVQFMVQAFLSVMLGGMGSFEGPIVGSIVMGAMVPGFQWLRELPGIVKVVSPVFAEVLIFVTALILVKLKPQGLLEQRRN